MVVSLRERGFVHEGKKFRLNPGYRSCRKLNTTISCQWSIWVDYTWMNIRASRKQILKWLRIVERKVQNQFSNCCIVSEIIYVFLFNLSKLYFLRCTILWRQMLPRDVRTYVLTRMKKVQANKSYQVAEF